METSIYDDLWQCVNERNFHENTIVLEALNRSQGIAIKNTNSTSVQSEITENDSDVQQWVIAFLDDFALVAAGPGGSSNVAAACLEISSDTCKADFTIRIAKNENFSNEQLSRMETMVTMLNEASSKSTDEPSELANLFFEIIFKCCRKRITKLFRNLQKRLDQQRTRNIRTTGCHDTIEKSDEISMALSQDDCVDESMRRLTIMAYNFRKRNDIQQLVQQLSTSRSTNAQKIVESLGKLARFYRSAITFAHVGRRGLRFKLEVVPSILRQVSALSSSSIPNLKSRIRRLNTVSTARCAEIRRLLGRSMRYVVHAEMLLLLYYDPRIDIEPIRNYIGISKRSCFLCANFPRLRGRFSIEGTHQQLYSLWTLPSRIHLPDDKILANIRLALTKLDMLVAEKVCTLGQAKLGIFPYNAESVANFSRKSIASAQSVFLRSTQRPIAPNKKKSSEPCLLEEEVESLKLAKVNFNDLELQVSTRDSLGPKEVEEKQCLTLDEEEIGKEDKLQANNQGIFAAEKVVDDHLDIASQRDPFMNSNHKVEERDTLVADLLENQPDSTTEEAVKKTSAVEDGELTEESKDEMEIEVIKGRRAGKMYETEKKGGKSHMSNAPSRQRIERASQSQINRSSTSGDKRTSELNKRTLSQSKHKRRRHRKRKLTCYREEKKRQPHNSHRGKATTKFLQSRCRRLLYRLRTMFGL